MQRFLFEVHGLPRSPKISDSFSVLVSLCLVPSTCLRLFVYLISSRRSSWKFPPRFHKPRIHGITESSVMNPADASLSASTRSDIGPVITSFRVPDGEGEGEEARERQVLTRTGVAPCTTQHSRGQQTKCTRKTLGVLCYMLQQVRGTYCT